jgi:Zn-dependent peptidase ImmA (M78 family)
MANARLERGEIERRAAEVLKQASVAEVPVDLSKVAESLGVHLHFDILEDKISGVLIVKGTERNVLINAAHHSNRQRFSLAHELGHLVLHDADGDRLFIDTDLRIYQRVGASTDEAYNQPGSTTRPHEEREANQFASALLMPSELVKREARNLDLSDESDVAYLARSFGVSDQAMAIRLQQLEVVNSVLTMDWGQASSSQARLL